VTFSQTADHRWVHARASEIHALARHASACAHALDFYCHKVGLIVEIDGPSHDAQKANDAEREGAFSDRGLMVIRFTNRQVMNNMPMVLNLIRGKIMSEDAKSPFPAGKGLGDGS